MAEVVLALVGILGTLAAVVITTWSNNRNSDRTRRRQAAEAKREAIGRFATELMEYRRVQLRLWYEATERLDSDLTLDRKRVNNSVDSAEKARQCRAETRSALHHVRLLWDDQYVLKAADRLFDAAGALEDEPDRDALKRARNGIDADLPALMDTVRQRLAAGRNE